MLIIVTKTQKAASCKLGIESKEYLQGETYNIFDDLAKTFIKEGWGVELKEKKEEPKIEEKSFEKAPENKAFEKAPEKKKLKLKNK